MKLGDVVKGYKERSLLSVRCFTDELNKGLPDGVGVTHVAVVNWMQGDAIPKTDYLIHLLLKTKDWRFDFALSCLGAIKPEVWGTPDGEMWQVARRIRGIK